MWNTKKSVAAIFSAMALTLAKGTITLRLSQMTDIQVRILTDLAFRKPLLSFSTDVLDALS